MGLLESINGAAKYLGKLAARVLGFASNNGTGSSSASGSGSSAGELLTWLRQRFAEDIRNNFTGGHDPDGTPWKPLKWRSGRPLILTGLLMNSAYLAAQHVELRNGTEICATMQQPFYWPFHEFGTRNIPARPFFGASKETVRDLADRMARDMAAELKAAGEG